MDYKCMNCGFVFREMPMISQQFKRHCPHCGSNTLNLLMQHSTIN